MKEDFNLIWMESEVAIIFKKDENIRGDFSEKRWKRIRSNIPSYKQFYNKNTIEKVSSLYAEDIERYGYSYGEKV